MATLFFTVFTSAGEVAQGDPLQHGTIDIGVSSTQGDVISAAGANNSRQRRRVRILCDADAFVIWGSDPTAASGSAIPMGSENPEYFDIESNHKIAVIQR